MAPLRDPSENGARVPAIAPIAPRAVNAPSSGVPVAHVLARTLVREQVEVLVNDADSEPLRVDQARDCVETAGLSASSRAGFGWSL